MKRIFTPLSLLLLLASIFAIQSCEKNTTQEVTREDNTVDLIFEGNQINQSQDISASTANYCNYVIVSGQPVNGGEQMECFNYDEYTFGLNHFCIPCEQPCIQTLTANIYMRIDGKLVHVYKITGLSGSKCEECPTADDPWVLNVKKLMRLD